MSDPQGDRVAVILAAGASTRLGSPKPLARVGGECLLQRAVRVALAAGLRVVVVLGAAAERIAAECDLAGCSVAVNAEWKLGMSSSIRVGIAAAQGLAGVRVEGARVEGAILMTCDQPAVTSAHLRRLLAEAGAGFEGEPVASSYAGKKGVPAYFPAGWFGDLSRLSGERGAGELLREARSVPLPLGELDVDTVEKLELAQSLFG